MTEQRTFAAETKELLDIVVHSLYTKREIFLRELISNASDALDRLRLESLLNSGLVPADHSWEIRLDTERTARTLTVSDTGIGMSREEVIQNIGTIARSGTKEFKRSPANGEQSFEGLIGQFGVGFYSVFMVAERVQLITRRAGEASATMWESAGDGVYSISDCEKPSCGTTVILHLRPVDHELGIEDYADKWLLERIVKRHSDFIAYPIRMRDVKDEVDTGNLGQPIKDTERKTVVEDRVLNSMNPLWERNAADIPEKDCHEFYRHITHDMDTPLKYMSFRAEGVHEYRALLFIPSKAPADLFYNSPDLGLKLYSRRVVVLEKTTELLPKYLRFMAGVVDSTGLPLNISRQQLQQDRHIAQIRRWLTRKVLDTLSTLKTEDAELYLRFWSEFGRVMKEGLAFDFDHKDTLLSLCLFAWSGSSKLISLREYVEAMPAEQKDILYLTGQSISVVENSPHLESIREKGWPVLYLVDPVDELILQYVMDFEGKRLKSVGKGILDLQSAEGANEDKSPSNKEEFQPLLSALESFLSAGVKQVRLSTRLRTSPACLVVEEHDYSPRMEQLLLKGKGGGERQRRVLELNPDHAIVKGLLSRHAHASADFNLEPYAQVLYGLALLAENSELVDPVAFTRAASEILTEAVRDVNNTSAPQE